MQIFVQGQELLGIRELSDMGFQSVFNRNKPELAMLALDRITLVAQDRKLVYDWIENNGRFENIPATVVSNSGVTSEYYLDLKGMEFTDTTVTVGIKPRKGQDHFRDNADNLSFELLGGLGLFEDYLQEVPYIIQKPELIIQAIILFVTGYSLVTEIIRTIKAISDLAADALDAVGTGVLTTIAKAVVLAVYLTALIIAIVNLLDQLEQLFFPKIRTLNACSDYNLIRIGCEYLGYKLESGLLSSRRQEHTLPVPLKKTNKSIFENFQNDLTDSFNKGWPTSNDTTPTLGALIEHVEQKLNAQVRVYNGIVKIETVEYFRQNPITTIEQTYNLRESRQQSWTYNDDDVWNRKYITWTVDYNDLHTASSFNGTDVEKSTQPISFQNFDLVNIAGLKGPTINFSLAARKKGLTKIEKTVANLFSIGDTLTGLFGKGTNYSGKVKNRDGVMLISEQFFSVTKKMWLGTDGKQPENYLNYISASAIYDGYHKDLEVSNNTRKIYKEMSIPFTDAQFFTLLQNNFVTLADTEEVAEILEVRWYDRASRADISYQIADTSGKKTKTVNI